MVEKLRMTSPDLTAANIETIAELFPSVVTETVEREGDDKIVKRAIDFDLLRQELSDHIVEGPEERYQLDWPGKREAAFVANAPIAKTLRPVREESVDFDTTQNLFIEGDNLDALKLLQESYLGKVKLIYIDPPYNTDNDFIYDDDFAESTEDYLARSSQADSSGAKLVANTEANGRFHSDWLSMIYPRLKLARNILSADGVLIVSVDDGEHAGLVEICKEIFGGTNYLASVARVTKKTSNKGTHFAPSKDYLVAIARNSLALGPLMDDVPDEYRKRSPSTRSSRAASSSRPRWAITTRTGRLPSPREASSTSTSWPRPRVRCRPCNSRESRTRRSNAPATSLPPSPRSKGRTSSTTSSPTTLS